MLIESPVNGRPPVGGGRSVLPLPEWLKSLKFRSSASRELLNAADAGDEHTFAKELRRGFRDIAIQSKDTRRNLLRGMQEMFVGSEHPGVECLDPQRLGKRQLDARLAELFDNSQEPSLDRLTWWLGAWLLILRPQDLSPEMTLTVWRRLFIDGEQLFAASETGTLTGGLLRHLELESELLHGVLFHGLPGGQKRQRQSVQAFRQALEDGTDTDGTPQARLLESLPEVLATLSRATAVAVAADLKLWNKGAVSRIEKLLHRSATLIAPGSVVWTASTPDTMIDIIEGLATQLPLDDHGRLASLLHSRKSSGSHKGRKAGKLPESSVQSDWAEWGVLRSGWKTKADVCSLRYDGSRVQLRAIVSGAPLLTGAWSHRLHVDGQEIPGNGDWSCVCWYDDDDAALMELEQASESSVRIFRQVILLKKESLLLLADSIRTGTGKSLEFSRTISVTPDWQYQQDSVTRELAFLQKPHRVRVIPLTSAQDRIQGTSEYVEFRHGDLRTAISANGPNLYSAMLFDWHPERRKSTVDWSLLTVAEDGQPVSRSLASGVRFRIGKKQWLLYHSLAKPAIPRTVLGQHTPNETLLGELQKDGSFRSLVEVES